MSPTIKEIQDIIQLSSPCAIRRIKCNLRLKEFVETHSHSSCITFSQKIYSAIHDGENVLCLCGSGIARKVKMHYTTLVWCSTACPVGKLEKKKSIEKTMMKRYGCKNAFQNDTFNKKRNKTMIEKYGDSSPIRISKFRKKIQETMMLKYDSKWAISSQQVKERSKVTQESHWGSHYSRRNLNKESLSILGDPSKLKAIVDELGFFDAAQELGCCISQLHALDRKYKLKLSSSASSLAERNIGTWLASMEVAYESHNRFLCHPREIDILIPNANLGIELDGLFWHSTLKGKDEKYHISKSLECKDKGVNLIHILEDEWENHREACKNFLLTYVNKNPILIAKESCRISPISHEDCEILLKRFEPSYWKSGRKLYGNALLHDGNILKAIVINDLDEIESIVGDNQYKIPHGLKYLWRSMDMHYTKLYADLRWYMGNDAAISLGFKLEKRELPHQWFTDGRFRWKEWSDIPVHRKKKALSLWDCGRDVYTYKK